METGFNNVSRFGYLIAVIALLGILISMCGHARGQTSRPWALVQDVKFETIALNGDGSSETCLWMGEVRGRRVTFPDGGNTSDWVGFTRFDVDPVTEQFNRALRFAPNLVSELSILSEYTTTSVQFLQFRQKGFSSVTYVIGWRPIGSRFPAAYSVVQSGWYRDQNGSFWPILLETCNYGGMQVGAINESGPIYSVRPDWTQEMLDNSDQPFVQNFRHLFVPTQFLSGSGYESPKYWFSLPEWTKGVKGEWLIKAIHPTSSDETQIVFGPMK